MLNLKDIKIDNSTIKKEKWFYCQKWKEQLSRKMCFYRRKYGSPGCSNECEFIPGKKITIKKRRK